MSYELSIERKKNWDDLNELSNISLEEWCNLIHNDDELEVSRNPYYADNPGFCEWNAHSVYKEEGARPYFDFRNGRLWTHNVDKETLGKMMEIAAKLNAKIIGQEGEVYDEEEFEIFNATDSAGLSPIPGAISKKPWWKFW